MGTDDHAIIPPLAPRSDEIVLNKVTRSAFSSTGIDQILRNLGVEGLVMTGVATNACVGMTASDAADRGYKVVVVEDATAAPSPILHEAALLNFAYLFGHVKTTDEVLSEMGLQAGLTGGRSGSASR
ncbi:MAG: cysteine hydrolase family protein [Armatimonadota bacterium]